jgi:hypothetical protein
MKDNTNNVRVRGIGWLDGRTWGCVTRHERVNYGDTEGEPPWKRPELFGRPVKNFGRFDQATRVTMTACALAVRDAALACGEGRKHNYALIGTNATGSLETNRAYFQDYLDAGRKLARGNLFIYTLPSSPLAETAIHFGLTGPMLYSGVPGGGLTELLEAGILLMADQGADGVLAVKADAREGLAVLLEAGMPAGSICCRTVCGACGGDLSNRPVRELVESVERGMREDGGI